MRQRQSPSSAGHAVAQPELLMHVGFDHYANIIAPELTGGKAAGLDPAIIDLDDIPGGLSSQGQAASKFTIVARTPTDLRRAIVHDYLMPSSRCIVVIIVDMASWHTAPIPSPCDEDLYCHRFGDDNGVKRADPWRNTQKVSVARGANYQWKILCEFTAAVPSALVVAAVCRSFENHRATGLGALAGPTGPGAIRVNWDYQEGNSSNRYITRKRLLSDAYADHSADYSADSSVSTLPVASRIPPVDERSINPIGYQRVSNEIMGVIEKSGQGYAITATKGPPIRLPLSGAVTEVEVAKVRPMLGIRLPQAPSLDTSTSIARILVNLAAAGVPLVSGERHSEWRPILGKGLVELIASTTEGDLRDSLHREEHSIRLRRYALNKYSTRRRWQDIAGEERLPLLGKPAVTVVISTKRANMVGFALEQVARQRDVDVDLIVALHGISRDDSRIVNAVSRYEGAVKVIEVSPHAVLGEVLNHAVKFADTALIAKMDDDDWYGQDHLSDLILSRRYSGAELVGCQLDFVYLESKDKTVRMGDRKLIEAPGSMLDFDNPTGATLLVSRNILEEVGGFKLVPRFEDDELCCAVRAMGGQVYVQHGLNFLCRRHNHGDHSWRAEDSFFVDAAYMEWPGVFFNALMTS